MKNRDEIRDEFDIYLAEQLKNPAFARSYARARAANPRKLPVDGREYHRRQQRRRGKR